MPPIISTKTRIDKITLLCLKVHNEKGNLKKDHRDSKMGKKRARKRIHIQLFRKYMEILEEDTASRRLLEIKNKLAKLGFKIEMPEDEREPYDRGPDESGQWYAINVYLYRELGKSGLELVTISGTTIFLPNKPNIPENDRVFGFTASENNRFFAIMDGIFK